eukprot:UN23106
MHFASKNGPSTEHIVICAKQKNSYFRFVLKILWISFIQYNKENKNIRTIFGLTPTPYTNSSSLINSVVKKISKYKCSFPC